MGAAGSGESGDVGRLQQNDIGLLDTCRLTSLRVESGVAEGLGDAGLSSDGGTRGSVRATCGRSRVTSLLRRLRAVVEPSAVTGSRAEWAAAAGAAQRVIDVASAVQDAAIARLAAIEPE